MRTLLPLPLPSSVATALPTAAAAFLPVLISFPVCRTPPRSSMSAAAAHDAAASVPAAVTAVGEEGGKEAGDVLVQYVVLRRDLADAWPLGSVVAQGCHAAVAAVWAHRDHQDTASYCGPDNLDRMHKACSTVCRTRITLTFDLHCSIALSVT
jgi:hypothetical protein